MHLSKASSLKTFLSALVSIAFVGVTILNPFVALASGNTPFPSSVQSPPIVGSTQTVAPAVSSGSALPVPPIPPTGTYDAISGTAIDGAGNVVGSSAQSAGEQALLGQMNSVPGSAAAPAGSAPIAASFSTAADAMCTPTGFTYACGCGLEMINGKCAGPSQNKFKCPCQDTSAFGFVTTGTCVAPMKCQALSTSDGLFDGSGGLLRQILGGLGVGIGMSLLQSLMSGGSGSSGGGGGGGSGGSSSGSGGSSGCTTYYQTSDISKLSDPCAEYVAPVSTTTDTTSTGTTGGCDPLAAALGQCGGSGTSTTDVGTGGDTGTTGGCDALSAALGLCGTSTGGNNNGGTGNGGNTNTGGNTNGQCDPVAAALGLCQDGSGTSTSTGTDTSGNNTDTGTDTNQCDPVSEALGFCGCSLINSALGTCDSGGTTDTNGGSATTTNAHGRSYSVIYTTRKNPDGTYTVTYTTSNAAPTAPGESSASTTQRRIIYQPVTGFKSSAQSGTRGDITDSTVLAGSRDEQKNVEVSGFYGSQTFGGPGSQGLVARWCQARPWAGGFLEKIVPASFFDDICKARGYQVGQPPAPAPTPPVTTLRQTAPAPVPVVVKPAVPATTTPVVTKKATSTPVAPPRVDIWAVPPTVPLGTRTSVFWSSQNVVDCVESSSDGQFSHRTLSGGSATVPITERTTFTITCEVSDGTVATKSVSVGLKL